MSFPTHHRVRRRSTVLAAILLLTLALAGALAYQALDAARSHRVAAERALRSFAAVAAWDYSISVKEQLGGVLARSFGPLNWVDLNHPGATLPPPDIIAHSTSEAARCADPALDRMRYYFRLDLRDGSLVTSGASVSPGVRRWIARVVSDHARAVYGTDWIYAHLYGTAEGRLRPLAYAVIREEATGRPVAAYGYESCMAAWGESVFEQVLRKGELLPAALLGDLPNDSLFSVTVTDQLGRELYRSPRQYPDTYSASYTLGDGYGGVTTRVSLSPAAAGRLALGGVPRSRVPFLLGLLALTAVLIGIVIVQLRREGELARLRSDFVSSVSHELRTPLAQIRMFAETLLLDRVRSEEERRRSLEIIDQEARRLTQLVGNVLQFSRAERQTVHLAPEPSDLAEEVRGALEVFEPLAAARRASLSAELEEEVVARVDRFALRQVLLNLLDNAVKYGPVGQTVRVSLSRREGRAVIRIADQGPGVAPRDRERIWEPFYRRERDANSAVAGSGIGLAVVRDLVTRHGGRSWVEGVRGGGSCFVVELPGVRPAGPAPAAAERALNTQASGSAV